ncbi:unnamed protein product [Cuscuta epithymum]|uniref:Arabidopsis retrotransposon Orf1 C-terminal domain-containing protein n=1 Tax=Cuscuta epithymum TaxID=186058 RepID=A0AAV0ESL7_9ASTE|nr:unnamed protein product [Cuscuta epithymum]
MAPRKNRGESSITIAPIPGFEDIIPADAEHRTRLLSTTKRQVKPSRFLCHDALRELGVYKSCRKFFHALDMDRIFNMKYNSNERIIYEFLSSVNFESDEADFRDDRLEFRLFNRNYSITKLEFAEHFGIPVPYERSISDNTMFGHTLWTRMTGEVNFSSSQMYISHVQHPVFRLFLKFLANCLLGRPNNHHTRIGDVCLMSVALFRRRVDFNLCNLMWAHLKKESIAKGAIVLGGVIMHLAGKFGYTDNSPIPDYCLMDIGWLGRSGCTSFSHTVYIGDRPKHMYNWIIHVQPVQYFLMPNPDTPKIIYRPEFDVPHFLFPHALPPHLQEPQAQDPPEDQPDQEPQPEYQEPEVAHHHMPEPNQASPPPDYFQQLLDGFNRVTNEVGKYREEQRAGFQRLEEQRAEYNRRYEEDQRRFYGPMYSYMAHQGQFHTMAQPPPPPSWYDPTQWGNFGGSSSGGGGFDGGDDGGDTHMGDGSYGGGFGGSYYGGEGGH